jgi:hypothetical protein
MRKEETSGHATIRDRISYFSRVLHQGLVPSLARKNWEPTFVAINASVDVHRPEIETKIRICGNEIQPARLPVGADAGYSLPV